jgi:hypothetical protein
MLFSIPGVKIIRQPMNWNSNQSFGMFVLTMTSLLPYFEPPIRFNQFYNFLCFHFSIQSVFLLAFIYAKNAFNFHLNFFLKFISCINITILRKIQIPEARVKALATEQEQPCPRLFARGWRGRHRRK